MVTKGGHLAVFEIEEDDKPTPSIRYYFSQPDILINLIVMSFGWLVSSFNYYMIAFLLKYFPGNFFINSVASSLSETAANILAGFIFS